MRTAGHTRVRPYKKGDGTQLKFMGEYDSPLLVSEMSLYTVNCQLFT